MKPARIIVIVIAAVAAIGLAFVVRMMGSGQPASQAAAAPVVQQEPTTKVLVAARELKPGQRLTEEDMTWKDWPIDALNVAFFTDGSQPLPATTAKNSDKPTVKSARRDESNVAKVTREAVEMVQGDAALEQFIGATVRETILQGEPIVSRKIVRAGDAGYMAAYLEPGMRAMAIGVSVESAAGGFILPGDRVDVLLTRESKLMDAMGGGAERSQFTTSTVMKNVKVLAIDQSTTVDPETQTAVGATATLELTPRDAEALALAKSEGSLSLVLRSYADTAGPSGQAAPIAPQAAAVRVFRGGDPEVVIVQ